MSLICKSIVQDYGFGECAQVFLPLFLKYNRCVCNDLANISHFIFVFTTFILMRTLGLLENLDMLVPEQKPSPMDLLKMQGKQVKRVRTKKD